jgi:hypothetical protein
MAKKFTAFTASSIVLQEVKILEARVESHEFFLTGNVSNFDPDCALRIFLGPVGDFLRAELKIWVDTESEPSQPEAHGHFHFNFYYTVDGLRAWVATSDDGEMILDFGLQNAIASVTYSTARGILISRFQGTAFQRFILPVVNPNELLLSSTPPRRKPKP